MNNEENNNNKNNFEEFNIITLGDPGVGKHQFSKDFSMMVLIQINFQP